MKQYLKKLIENNELEQAIEQLFELYALCLKQGVGDEIEKCKDSLSLIRRNLISANQEENKGSITSAEAHTLKVKVANALMDVVNDLPPEVFDVAEPPAQQVLFQTLPTEHKVKIDQQIYLKCDRVDLIKDLKDVFDDNDTVEKPIVIFLPGFLDDEHYLAVKKINFAISSHFETPILAIKAEDWDNNKLKDKQFKRVSRSVRESFEQVLKDKHITEPLPDRLENAKAFVDIPLLKEHVILFEQEIDLEYWTDASFRNLGHFLRTFWNFEIAEDRSPVFVVYSLVYGKTKSLTEEQIEKIKTDIERLNNEFEIENAAQFDDLSEINRGHIVSFYQDCDICDAEDFMEDGETRRLRKVLPNLRKILLKHELQADEDAIANL